jgi:hypothetical protein
MMEYMFVLKYIWGCKKEVFTVYRCFVVHTYGTPTAATLSGTYQEVVPPYYHPANEQMMIDASYLQYSVGHYYDTRYCTEYERDYGTQDNFKYFSRGHPGEGYLDPPIRPPPTHSKHSQRVGS